MCAPALKGLRIITVWLGCALMIGLSACQSDVPDFIASKPLVELAMTTGDVRPLELRAGLLHLEATCDLIENAVCGAAAARWCSTTPDVYDQQSFRDGEKGEKRTVWLARCSPRNA